MKSAIANSVIPNSVIRIPCQSLQSFFEAWLNILKPIHKLPNAETRLLATMLRHRHELSQKIIDRDLLDEYIMGGEIKQKIREELGITSSSLQVSLYKLKRSGAIKDGRINPKLIPTMKDNNYKLLLYFDLKTDDNAEKHRQDDRQGSGEGTEPGLETDIQS